MSTEQVILSITEGRTALGIEFGSTRIKAVLTDETTAPIAQGSHQWENRLVNNIWTYTMEDIMTGLQACYRDLARDVREKYGRELTTIGSIGISAMMHGPFQDMEKYHHAGGIRKADGTLSVQYSAALEHCPFVPGNLKWGGSSDGAGLPDNTGRFYSLETDRKEGAGSRGRFRHVPN